ncbi:hypothetical protein KBY58_11410 [Cyanobium sp. HWJ4-Hawea]|nr:hypothetical protein [Cyanobium sp. HWJ4-Hawea]
MRTSLELPDPLFARLKARAAVEQVTLKQLLHSYVEQGLNTTAPTETTNRSVNTLPKLDKPLAIASSHLNNASLFELLDA